MKLEKSHLEKELQVAQSKVPATPPPPPAASTKSGSSKPTPKTTRDTTLITELNQEVELLRKKNTMFQKQIKEYEAKISYLQSMVSNGNGSGSKSNTTNHGFHEEVKEDELRAIRSQLDAKEGILQEVSYQRDRLQTLFDSCNDTLQVLQGEYQSLQQQYDAVQESQQHSAETMQQLQQEVRIRQQQCQQMEEECRQLKLQVATLQQQQQQQQSSRPLPQVPSVAASESTTTTTAAASSNALVKLRLHEERIQQLQHENQVLQSTITQLQSDQLLTKERYSTQQIAVNDESHRIVALEDLIVTYKHQIETLQHTQNNLQQEVVTYLKDKDSLERKISLQSHQLDDEVNKRKLAETQCIQIQTQMETLSFQHHQVKDMISRYEVKYQHQQEQLQQYEHVMERLQIDKQHWHDEKDLLETRLHEQEDKINQLKQVLQEVDTQRDELQDQVESLEDQVKMKSMETKHYHEQQMEYQQMITSQEKTIQSKQHEITQLMKFSQEMDGKLHVLLEEKQTLQRQCHDKLRKEGVMSEDLMLMTKENQALSSELSRLCHERDSFLQQLREHMTQLQLMESNKHSLEIEKHDLLENYRVVVKEKRKMEDEVRLLR